MGAVYLVQKILANGKGKAPLFLTNNEATCGSQLGSPWSLGKALRVKDLGGFVYQFSHFSYHTK